MYRNHETGKLYDLEENEIPTHVFDCFCSKRSHVWLECIASEHVLQAKTLYASGLLHAVCGNCLCGSDYAMDERLSD